MLNLRKNNGKMAALINNSNVCVKIGCDIADIARFKNIERKLLLKIFHENEIKGKTPENIAGLFAAKESCRKVFNKLGWHDITIKTMKNGKPLLSMDLGKIDEGIQIISSDLSISHDGNYAIATSVFLIRLI